MIRIQHWALWLILEAVVCWKRFAAQCYHRLMTCVGTFRTNNNFTMNEIVIQCREFELLQIKVNAVFVLTLEHHTRRIVNHCFWCTLGFSDVQPCGCLYRSKWMTRSTLLSWHFMTRTRLQRIAWKRVSWRLLVRQPRRPKSSLLRSWTRYDVACNGQVCLPLYFDCCSLLCYLMIFLSPWVEVLE